MISRRDAMIRPERASESTEDDLRISPRTHAERNAVPGKPSGPGAGRVTHLDISRVAGVCRLRAKSLTGNRDRLRLLW